MNIIEVKENKKQYLDLLLLADEQESLIDAKDLLVTVVKRPKAKMSN